MPSAELTFHRTEVPVKGLLFSDTSRAEAATLEPMTTPYLCSYGLFRNTMDTSRDILPLPPSFRVSYGDCSADPGWVRLPKSPNSSDYASTSPEAQIASLLQSVYRRVQAENEDAAIDDVFDFVNDELMKRRFWFCDQLLREVDFDRVSPAILVALLTITVAAKSELPYRKRFFDRVFERVTQQRGDHVAQRMLSGLE